AIDDVIQNEGSTGGTTSFTFTVTKTGATTQSATEIGRASCRDTVYNSGGATAANSNTDYISQAGTPTFAPRDTIKTITVPVCADTTVELTETFTVKLSCVTGGSLQKDWRSDWSLDVCSADLAIDDVIQNEGSTGGTTSFTFTVTKTGATTQSATVSSTTDDATATANSSCATAPTGTPDYISQTGTLSFAPSDTIKTITVPVCAETTFELTETFTVKLSGAICFSISNDTRTLPSFPTRRSSDLIDDVIQNEGSTGGTTSFTFTVTKTGATTQSATV